MARRMRVQEAQGTARLLRIRESATTATGMKRNDDGSYRVVIITEGEGSSGSYSAELVSSRTAPVFEGAASFMDHPDDASRPDKRSLGRLMGRVRNLEAEQVKGKWQVAGDYVPRKEYAEFVEEFADIIGLSIYCGVAEGEELPDGRINVREFDHTDPYRSVDLVVAPGRGGRFKRAEESLRAIESSLGTPPATQPGAASAPGQKREGSMLEKEDLEAIAKLVTESLAPLVTFVNEQKDAADKLRQAEADAADKAPDVKDAIEAYATKSKAVSEAEISDLQKAKILEALTADVTIDVAPLIATETKIAEQLRTTVAESAGAKVWVGEGSAPKHDYSTGGRI